MKTKLKFLLVLASIIVVLDQITKMMVISKFYLHESIDIITGVFNFTYIRNTGAAFGFLAHAPSFIRIPFFVIIPIVALIMIYQLFKKLPADSRWLSSSLGLIVGGAIGNVIDRVRFGYVIDFLDFHWKGMYHYPAFNIADSAICVGVAILMFEMIFKKNSPFHS